MCEWPYLWCGKYPLSFATLVDLFTFNTKKMGFSECCPGLVCLYYTQMWNVVSHSVSPHHHHTNVLNCQWEFPQCTFFFLAFAIGKISWYKAIPHNIPYHTIPYHGCTTASLVSDCESQTPSFKNCSSLLIHTLLCASICCVTAVASVGLKYGGQFPVQFSQHMPYGVTRDRGINSHWDKRTVIHLVRVSIPFRFPSLLKTTILFVQKELKTEFLQL